MESEYFLAREVARILRVSLSCVQRWLLSGRLRGYRRGPRGRWLIEKADLEAFLTTGKTPEPVKRPGRVEAAKAELRKRGYRV